MIRWGTFCKGAQIDEEAKVAQFVSSLSEELQSKLGRTNENYGELGWAPLVELVRERAIVPTAIGRLRDDAIGGKQKPGERIRPFYLRCKGLVRDPDGSAPAFKPPACRVDYSEHILAMACTI